MIQRQSDVFGVKLIEDPNIGEYKQVRFPRTKKARIQKKWRKDRSNFRFVPSKSIYHFKHANTIVAHPITIDIIKKHIQNKTIDNIMPPPTPPPPASNLFRISFGFQPHTKNLMSILDITTA